MSGASSYDVRYRVGTSGSWIATLTGITGLSQNITGLIPNTTYQYEVSTVCSSLSSNWGLSTLTTLSDLGIGSTSLSGYFRIFPNPITNTFSVELPLDADANLDISIVDVNGQMVKDLYNGTSTSGDNIFLFDKSNLASGVYFLIINVNGQTIKNEKIIVN